MVRDSSVMMNPLGETLPPAKGAREIAQRATIDLRSAVRGVLPACPADGLTVARIYKTLGSNQGYPES